MLKYFAGLLLVTVFACGFIIYSAGHTSGAVDAFLIK